MKVYKYGANVDTDVIIPARHLNDPSPAALASHCMEDIDPRLRLHRGGGGHRGGRSQLRLRLQPGARPSGPEVLRGEVRHRPSFARIFYRNAINIGFPIVECAQAAQEIQAGDQVDVDFSTGVITDTTQGKTWQAAPFPEFIDGIIKSGGLLQLPEGPGGGEMNYKIALIKGDGIGPEVVGGGRQGHGGCGREVRPHLHL